MRARLRRFVFLHVLHGSSLASTSFDLPSRQCYDLMCGGIVPFSVCDLFVILSHVTVVCRIASSSLTYSYSPRPCHAKWSDAKRSAGIEGALHIRRTDTKNKLKVHQKHWNPVTLTRHCRIHRTTKRPPPTTWDPRDPKRRTLKLPHRLKAQKNTPHKKIHPFRKQADPRFD